MVRVESCRLEANQKHVDLIEALSDILKAQLDPAPIPGHQHRCRTRDRERDPLTYRHVPDLMVFRQEARYATTEAKNGGIDPYIWTIPRSDSPNALSPSNRKGSLGDLLADYERIAAPEVWLLDPEPRLGIVPDTATSPGAIARNGNRRGGGVVTPHLPPNITVNLEDLWAAFHGDAARC